MSEKMIIGLNGGIDSAVAVTRLLKQGYGVHTFFMKLKGSDYGRKGNPIT